MNLRDFGKTDLRVGEIGFGAWAIGGEKNPVGYGPTDDGESRAAIRRALDLGVTFFDTADIYGKGHSEALVGEVLEGKRRDVAIATKVGYDFTSGPKVQPNFDAAYVRRALEASLKRLRTDHVDLYQLHNPDVEQIRAAAATMRGLKAEGRARFVGASIATEEEALAAIGEGYDAIQLVYSYVDTGHDRRTLRAAREAGVAVIAREPLCRGLLTGKFARSHDFADADARSRWDGAERERIWDAVEEFLGMVRPGAPPARAALKFVLSRPEISVAIPGAKRPAQVEENVSASDGRYDPARDVFRDDAGLGGDA